jgi:hypothetical protein
MNDSVVAIVAAFFIIGITVGVIAVIALSVLRAERRRAPGDEDDPGRGPGGPGQRPPGSGWDDDDHPGWPGDADNDFSGR